MCGCSTAASDLQPYRGQVGGIVCLDRSDHRLPALVDGLNALGIPASLHFDIDEAGAGSVWAEVDHG